MAAAFQVPLLSLHRAPIPWLAYRYLVNILIGKETHLGCLYMNLFRAHQVCCISSASLYILYFQVWIISLDNPIKGNIFLN